MGGRRFLGLKKYLIPCHGCPVSHGTGRQCWERASSPGGIWIPSQGCYSCQGTGWGQSVESGLFSGFLGLPSTVGNKTLHRTRAQPQSVSVGSSVTLLDISVAIVASSLFYPIPFELDSPGPSSRSLAQGLHIPAAVITHQGHQLILTCPSLPGRESLKKPFSIP